MEFSGAYKKATAALDEAARARLRGPFVVTPSSSSSGRADADDDDDLMDLVDEFYNGYGADDYDGAVVTKDDDAAASRSRVSEWKETVRSTLAEAAADAAAVPIIAEAERIVRGAGSAVVGGGGGIRKHLVARLRARGYDAGLCRSSWEMTSSIAAPGTYEYVDVTLGSPTSRYIVEANVTAEFEIARPSAEYQDLLATLPPVLVARPGAMKELAAAMCAAAAESIRGAGLHVPPWRRAPYVQAKWSARFERTHEAAIPVATTATKGPRHEGGGEGERRRAVVVRGRRHGVGKNCGMEMGRRQGVIMGREALASVLR